LIKLIQFPPSLGIPNASPFCMKLENQIRLLGLPYENKYIEDPRKYPKGKLPAIEHNGKLMADTRVIAPYLISLAEHDPDAVLTPEQQGISHAMHRMLEESLYFVVMHMRWIDDNSWPKLNKNLFSHLKPPLSWVLPGMLRKKVARDLQGQGTGRMTSDEILQLGQQDLAALEGLLGDKSFLFGAEPTMLDATAQAFLAGICHSTMPIALGKPSDALVSYCDRMKAHLYPDGYP